MKTPNVTAGLTCPPEILALTETATRYAKARAKASETSPAGVDEPLLVSLSDQTKKKIKKVEIH